MSSYRCVLLVVLCIGLLQPSGVFAQTSTATLTGAVRDATGAILPSVSITLTNTERNSSQSTIGRARSCSVLALPRSVTTN